MAEIWRTHQEPLPFATGYRYEVFENERELSFGQALSRLENDADFRDWLSGLLARHEFRAFRWETPAIKTSTLSRRFEYVLIEDDGLDRAPDEAAFAAHFRDSRAEVAAIANLGRTSELIVPRGIVHSAHYAHLAAFLRGAPSHQQHALWQCVAQTVQRRLSQRPLWLSTAGAGVAWLHVRVDPTPKYYAHRPYREIPVHD